MTVSNEQLQDKIYEQLVASGEYGRIEQDLKQKLLESGWYDSVRNMASAELMRLEPPKFSSAIPVIESRALNQISDEVKTEILTKIKQAVDKIIE